MLSTPARRCSPKTIIECALDGFRFRVGAEDFARTVDFRLMKPMWNGGPSGWRPADSRLKSLYPEVAGKVVAPDSLFGSMAIKGRRS